MGAGASTFELQQPSELQQKVLDYSNGDAATDMTTLELSETAEGEVVYQSPRRSRGAK